VITHNLNKKFENDLGGGLAGSWVKMVVGVD